MAKLYFRYGAMCSAKTLNLLAVAHNYKSQGKKILLLKPKLDDRYGNKIESRAGLRAECDMEIDGHVNLLSLDFSGIDCVLVDEAQFLDVKSIEHLRWISINNNIPVICYGLRTDFQTNTFPGSKRLLELSDSIEEIKTTCVYCNRKAIFNMRLLNGRPIFTGNQIEVGGNDKYESVCANCYYDKLK